MSTVINNIVTFKDSRWLTLEVCREFQRNKCTRSDTECKYAHPLPHVEVQNGRVTACFDSIKGRCNREKPPCKYLHPPQHLKEQLLVNGRNNLALKNAALMGQFAAAANASFTATPLLQIPLVGGSQSGMSPNALAALGPLLPNGTQLSGNPGHQAHHHLGVTLGSNGGTPASNSGNGTSIVLTPHPHSLTPFTSSAGGFTAHHHHSHHHHPGGAGPLPLTGTEILIAPDGTPLVLGYIIPPQQQPPPHHHHHHHNVGIPSPGGPHHHHPHHQYPQQQQHHQLHPPPPGALLPPPPSSMLPPPPPNPNNAATVIPVMAAPSHYHHLQSGGNGSVHPYHLPQHLYQQAHRSSAAGSGSIQQLHHHQNIMATISSIKSPSLNISDSGIDCTPVLPHPTEPASRGDDTLDSAFSTGSSSSISSAADAPTGPSTQMQQLLPIDLKNAQNETKTKRDLSKNSPSIIEVNAKVNSNGFVRTSNNLKYASESFDPKKISNVVGNLKNPVNLKTPASLCSSSSLKSFPSSGTSSPVPLSDQPAPLVLNLGVGEPQTYADVLQNESNVNKFNVAMSPSSMHFATSFERRVSLTSSNKDESLSTAVVDLNSCRSDGVGVNDDHEVCCLLNTVVRGGEESPFSSSLNDNTTIPTSTPHHQVVVVPVPNKTTNISSPQVALSNNTNSRPLVKNSPPPSNDGPPDDDKINTNQEASPQKITNGFHYECSRASTSAIYINASLNSNTNLAQGISGSGLFITAPSPVKTYVSLPTQLATLEPAPQTEVGRKRGRIEASIFYEPNEILGGGDLVGRARPFSRTQQTLLLSSPVLANHKLIRGGRGNVLSHSIPNNSFISPSHLGPPELVNNNSSTPNMIYYYVPSGQIGNQAGGLIFKGLTNHPTTLPPPLYSGNGQIFANAVPTPLNCSVGTANMTFIANPPHVSGGGNGSYYPTSHPQQFLYVAATPTTQNHVIAGSARGSAANQNPSVGHHTLLANNATGVALNAIASPTTGFLTINGGLTESYHLPGATCIDPSIGFLNTGVKRIAYQAASNHQQPHINNPAYIDGLTGNPQSHHQYYYQNNHNISPNQAYSHQISQQTHHHHQPSNYGAAETHSFQHIIGANGTFHHPQSILANVSAPLGNHQATQYIPVAFATPGAVNGLPPF